MTPLIIFQISFYIISIGLIITTFEQLSIRNNYKNGFFRWELSNNNYYKAPSASRLFNFLCDSQFLVFVLLARLISLFMCFGITLLTGSPPFILLILISISLLLFNYRNSKGLDGSDQMFVIVIVTLTLWSVDLFNTYLSWSCIFFLAGQSSLAYTTAGFAKLFSPTWKNGSATIMIMDTQTFGNKNLSGFLLDNLFVNKLLAWYIIIWESCFILSLVNPIFLFFFLATGFFFHVYNAFIMGLNGFLWSFIATYPSIIYICYSLEII